MTDPRAKLEADMAQAEQQAPDDDSIPANFARLIASGRELAAAELDWAKAKAMIVAAVLRRSLVLAVLALVLLLFGIAVLVAAAVIALAPYVGWLGAALIVSGLLFALTIILGLAAKRTLAGLSNSGDDL